MQFSIVALLISVAVATPLTGSYGNGGSDSAAPACQEGTKVSCCSQPGGASGGELSNIIGGDCELAELVSLVPIGAICPASDAMCCPTNSSGAIDVTLSCIPINA